VPVTTANDRTNGRALLAENRFEHIPIVIPEHNGGLKGPKVISGRMALGRPGGLAQARMRKALRDTSENSARMSRGTPVIRPGGDRPPLEAGVVTVDALLGEIASLLADLHMRPMRHLDLSTDLVRDAGLDSLATVELHDRLEQAFGVVLSEEVLATAVTPADWLHAILEARGQPQTTTAGDVTTVPSARAPGQSWPEDAETLTECLVWHAERHPHLVGIRLVGAAAESDTDDITYGSLMDQASACARGLVAEGLGRGERVAIMLPTGRDYFVVFVGALLAGGVPVPIYPPARPEVLEEHVRRQARLLSDAGASVLVTLSDALLIARLVKLQVPTIRVVRTRQMLAEVGSGYEPLRACAADDIALIQYTSGSTGDPKGVVLTQRQVLANIRAMGVAADVSSSDVFVSWLPLYHDMGLIGAWHAASVYFGMLLVAMSPLDFLARPASWLEALTRYSGTLSAAPNFAYQSCVDRIGDDQLERFDLSSWRLAFNGSEPVSARTIERFVDRFSRCGFRREAMCPAYGLAEVGVGAAFTPLGSGPRVDSVSRHALAHSGRAVPVSASESGAICFVSCGTALPGYEIRVSGTAGRELPDRHEGRVECRGPSVTTGYFGRPEASREMFRRGWLDTGDLGYVADGDLFLTGRAKDLIIRAGRNLHPEELEQELGELSGLHREGVAVFASVDPSRGTERLIVAAETASVDTEELRTAITRRVVELLGTGPDDVVLVGPGTLPRTASGKIRRAAARQAFESGVLGRTTAPVTIQLVHFAWSGLRPAVRRLVRALRTWAYASYVWALIALTGIPLWGLLQLPFSMRIRWQLTRAAGQSLRVLSGIGLRIEGEIPPSTGPIAIVSNHPSFVDGLVVVLASHDPVVFVASTDFERKPLVGRFMRRLGCEFVHRDAPGASSPDLARLVKVLHEGRRIAVFPEGSIVRVPGLRRFHLGAFAAVSAAGCDVLPIGIRGTRDVVRPGTYTPHRATVTVVIGDPLSSSGDGFASWVELSDRTRAAIAALSGERAM
jgi:1-acyl-sn-glycerol-3-phosphate acyltransferase